MCAKFDYDAGYFKHVSSSCPTCDDSNQQLWFTKSHVKDCMVKGLSSIFYLRGKGEFIVICQVIFSFANVHLCLCLYSRSVSLPNSLFHWFAIVSHCHHFTIDGMFMYDVHNTMYMYLGVIKVGCILV